MAARDDSRFFLHVSQRWDDDAVGVDSLHKHLLIEELVVVVQQDRRVAHRAEADRVVAGLQNQLQITNRAALRYPTRSSVFRLLQSGRITKPHSPSWSYKVANGYPISGGRLGGNGALIQ